MTIICLIVGCKWKTAVKYQGRELLHSQVCDRCGAHMVVSG